MDEKIIVCVQCGREFSLTHSEMARITEHGFDIPKRCPECRRKKHKTHFNSNLKRFKDKAKKARLRDERKWKYRKHEVE